MKPRLVIQQVQPREPQEPKWLLLVHRVPQKPDYLRIKVRRRLHAIGAVAVKNSVYVLPRNDQALEDFQWTMREIAAIGGEASICEASFVDGLSDAQIRTLFGAERAEDYKVLSEEARRIRSSLGRHVPRNEAERTKLRQEAASLRRKLRSITAIDFFGEAGRKETESMIAELEAKSRTAGDSADRHQPGKTAARGNLRGKIWVTRKNIHVDRIASAWLLRRFVDPKTKFKFVDEKGYKPRDGEVRFDMFEGEFTHEGERCTFETIVRRFAVDDEAVQQIAEIIHDIDLKDGKFGREEAAGVAMMIAGICQSCPKDEDRVERGLTLMDDFYASFGGKQPKAQKNRNRIK